MPRSPTLHHRASGVTGRRTLDDGAADLVLLVVLGDLIQNGVTQSDMSVTGVTIAVTTFALLSVASSYLVFKSRRARNIIEGTPLIVVQDGKLIEANLRSERMSADDVMEEARRQQIDVSTRSSGECSSERIGQLHQKLTIGRTALALVGLPRRTGPPRGTARSSVFERVG